MAEIPTDHNADHSPGMNWLLLLPEELIVRILSLLPTLSDVAHCRQTNKQLLRIGGDNLVWMELCRRHFACNHHSREPRRERYHGVNRNRDCNRTQPYPSPLSLSSFSTSNWMSHVKRMHALIRKYGTIDDRDLHGNTVLHRELERKKAWESDDSVSLIEHGVDLDVRNHNGETPLHTAVRRDDEFMVSMLIGRHADANVANHLAIRPVHLAAQVGNERMVRMLVEHGNASVIDISSPSSSESTAREISTPLHTAAKFGHTGIVRLLVNQYGAPLNARDRGRMTPLHLAVACAKLSVIRLLIDLGADIDARDDSNRTPFDIALHMGLKAVVHLFNVVRMFTPASFSHYHPSGVRSVDEERSSFTPCRLSDWSMCY